MTASLLVDIQVTQPLQPVIDVVYAEPVPSGPQQRDCLEPYPTSWLARAARGALVEIFLQDLGLALGRGRFDGLEVLGSHQALPGYAAVRDITWYGGRSTAELHAFGLCTLLETHAAELLGDAQKPPRVLYPVMAHTLRPVQEDDRFVSPFALPTCRHTPLHWCLSVLFDSTCSASIRVPRSQYGRASGCGPPGGSGGMRCAVWSSSDTAPSVQLAVAIQP
jgi:hypothetical protein